MHQRWLVGKESAHIWNGYIFYRREKVKSEDCRSSGLVVLSAAPTPTEKCVWLVLVLLFFPQTTVGCGVVALAGAFL